MSSGHVTDTSPFWLTVCLCGAIPDGIPLEGPLACLKSISNLFPAEVLSSFRRQTMLSKKCLEPIDIVIWLSEAGSGMYRVLANIINVFSVHFISEKKTPSETPTDVCLFESVFLYKFCLNFYLQLQAACLITSMWVLEAPCWSGGLQADKLPHNLGAGRHLGLKKLSRSSLLENTAGLLIPDFLKSNS